MPAGLSWHSSGGLLGADPGWQRPPTHIAALAESAKGAWRLLLQLDLNSESGVLWGDTGMLYFWVSERGLKEKDFDDVWVVMQTT